jgi:pilus assembly protein Flp/PilA
MRTLVNRLVRDDQGQDLIEYAILIGLITVGVVAIVASIGSWVQGQFTDLQTDLTSAS